MRIVADVYEKDSPNPCGYIDSEHKLRLFKEPSDNEDKMLYVVSRPELGSWETFHKLWTAAVSTPGYDKEDWKLLEQYIPGPKGPEIGI